MTPTPCMADMFHGNSLPYATYVADRAGFKQMVAGGWPFLIHKLSQGSSFIDPKVVGRLAQAALVPGMQLGVYHFMDASPIQAQIANFVVGIHLLRAAIPANDFIRMAVDNEPSTIGLAVTAGTDMLAMQMAEFMHTVNGGRRPLIYGDASEFFSARSIGSMAACPRWLAKYGPDASGMEYGPGWTNCQWQQFSDGTTDTRGLSVPGFAGTKLDMSEFSGSLDEAIATWKA